LLLQARAAKAEGMFAGEDRAGRRYAARDEELGLRHLGGATADFRFRGKSGGGHYARRCLLITRTDVAGKHEANLLIFVL
jgi:hypothetical protein